MATENENLANALTEVSERLSVLVREEIELAKAEVTVKVSSIARGAAAVAVGAVFGVFALIFLLSTIAWAINDASGSLWPGFLSSWSCSSLLTVGAFLFAKRKLKVGAPTPEDGHRGGGQDPPDAQARTGRLMADSLAGGDPRLDRGQSGRTWHRGEKLRVEVVRLTDWRAQLRRYEPQVLVGAAAAGFVIGGGLAAVGALTFGRRKRKKNLLGR